MCYIQTKRGITGNSDTTNTNSPWGTMSWPCPRRSVVKKSQVKCHSQGGQNKRPLEGRVKAPTRTKRSITQQEKMEQQPKARKTGPMPHCLSLEAIQASVETTILVVDRALAVRGGGTQVREPSHSSRHASPMHKNPPGGPKVSRGTRNTHKNKKK